MTKWNAGRFCQGLAVAVQYSQGVFARVFSPGLFFARDSQGQCQSQRQRQSQGQGQCQGKNHGQGKSYS